MSVPGFTETELRAGVAAAVRAPSMLNSQPWRFRLRDGGIEVYIDTERRLLACDRRDWAARVACGAAVFNLRLALAVAGRSAGVTLQPYPADPDVVARLVPAEPRPASGTEESLAAAVVRRHSNRAPFWPDPVPADARWRLIQAARAEGAWLELVIGTAPVGAVAEITHSANRVLERDPAYRAELARWTRASAATDGVLAASGGPVAEPQDLLPQRPFATHVRAPGRDFEPEPLIAVLGTSGNATTDQLTAGQALQRVLLTATDSGLATSMLSQPIEVASAREQLRLALGRYGVPQMVIRIGYGQPSSPTPRRGVDEVVDVEAPTPAPLKQGGGQQRA